MDRLSELIDARTQARKDLAAAHAAVRSAHVAIEKWGREQVRLKLAELGIRPKRAIVRINSIRTEKIGDVLFVNLDTAMPPTMPRDALGPNSFSSDMWWSVSVSWRNILKNGQTGAITGFSMISGRDLDDLASHIVKVREINP